MPANKENNDGDRKGSVRQSAKSSNSVAGLPQKRNAPAVRLKSGNPYKTDFKGVSEDRFQAILQRVRSMTAEEFRESLRAVGIIDKSGKLTKPYRS